MNEEEVKVKIVLPFLARLGFNASELQLETSFFIRVGRHALDIIHAKTPKRAGVGARLDILVKRDQKNLFIVETKDRDLELTDDDRDQAISYARLVHPIAPFALVTNGADWKLFDTVSKRETSLNDFKIRDHYTITLPEAATSEALANFLGYSIENVQSFCNAQVSSSLEPLLGSPSDLTKKYVPELHVPDDGVKAELQRFMAGSAAGFLIAAESGMGKTCELCHRARELLQQGDNAVLFFEGHLIEASVTQAVAEEFNWTFSEQLSPVALFSKLERTFKHRAVVVCIDAIDEWTYSQRIPNFFNFLRLAGDHRIKVVFTCKSASWQTFSMRHGSSNGIDGFLHRVRLGNNTASQYVLGGFSSQRLTVAIEKYSTAFGIRPQFEVAVLDEAQRNPFLLRVFYTVARAHSLLQCTFSSAEFFRNYYGLTIAKAGTPEIVEAQLIAVARIVWETDEDTVDLQTIRTKLGLGLNEALLPALFEYSILTKSTEFPTRIGFYFQQLRDFIISFLVLKWPNLDQNGFASMVEPLKREGVQADVLAFYYRHASESQRRAVDGPLFESAKRYLAIYSELIGRHFSALRLRFTPHTDDRIGFIAELMVARRTIGFHGFRQIKEGDSEVLFIPVTGMFAGSNSLDLHGGIGPFSSVGSFGNATLNLTREVIESECERQLNRITDDEWLNEETAADLMLEKLAAIVLAQPHYFQELLREPNPPFPGIPRHIRVLELAFPFNWPETGHVFCRRILMDKLRDDLLRKKATDYKGPEIPGVHGPVITAEDQSVIMKRADGILASGSGVEITNHRLTATATELFNILSALTKMGATREWSWMDRGVLYNVLRDDPLRGMEILKEYLVKLFAAFLESYKSVIDHNFPTLCSHFRLRRHMPICAFIGIGPRILEEVRTGRIDTGGVRILFCLPKAPKTANSVTAVEPNEVALKSPDIEFKGESYTIVHSGSSPLHPLTFSSLAQSGMGQLQNDLPVRKLVYEQIKAELPEALKQFRAICGV